MNNHKENLEIVFLKIILVKITCISPKGRVQIPDKLKDLIAYIMQQEVVNVKSLKDQFKGISSDAIAECLDSRKNECH